MEEFRQNSTSILGTLSDIQSNIKSPNDNYDSSLASMSFCSDQISMFEATMKLWGEKLATVDTINKDNQLLKSEVKTLEYRIDALEQYTRLNNIEIHGIPEKANENVFNILSTIGEHIKCSIRLPDIGNTHRVTHQSASTQPKAIIVKFTTRLKRDAVLTAAKTARIASADYTP